MRVQRYPERKSDEPSLVPGVSSDFKNFAGKFGIPIGGDMGKMEPYQQTQRAATAMAKGRR
jgi:hypothetical protein